MLKILHVSQSDIDGGAAKAAFRLSVAERNNGLDAKIFVMRKLSNASFTFGAPGLLSLIISRILPQIERAVKNIAGVKKGRSWSFNWIFNPLLKYADFTGYDLVHLHWLGKNMLNHTSIAEINTPLVWTLHDSWPFTAGCHIPDNCCEYKLGCVTCPQISAGVFTKNILNYMFISKLKAYEKKEIHFIAPSQWIADCARSSKLLSGLPVHVIPNGICTNTFYPFEKSNCVAFFNFPVKKNIILFGAMYADTDHNKGLDLLVNALHILCDHDPEFEKNSILVIFGASKNFGLPKLNLQVESVGVIRDQTILAKLFSASTVTVVPSRSESFGQVAAESLSCGTPVVAFRCSGLIDIVDHGLNGYLATPYKADDLAKGINFILSNESNQNFKKNARDKVMKNFDSNIVAIAHSKLYESIIKRT